LSSFFRRFLVPDLALILAAITVLYCLTSFNGMQQLFRDSDTGWHIRNGETVLETSTVPYTESYSFSKPSQPWFAWEWLADCIMAKAHSWDGLRGVFFLYAMVLGTVTWLWFQLLWATKTWFIVGAVSTWVMLSTTNIHWLARPHLMGWIFLLLAVLMAEHASNRIDLKYAALVFVLGCLWANIHASFFLGAGIFFLYAAEKWLRNDVGWKPLALFSFLALASSFVNPYGWHVHEHIINYLMDKELISHIGEFQSFNFHNEGAGALVVCLLLAATGISLNLIEGRWARAALCLILFIGALRSARGLPLVALIALPLALSAMCSTLEKIPFFAGIATYNRNLRSMDSGFRGWALMPIIFGILVFVGRSNLFANSAGFPEDLYPVKLSSQIQSLPADARLFSTDAMGGYLIYRFAGRRKVFFDGRSDYYGSEFLTDYLLIPATKPGWWKQWERWNFTHALVPKDSSLIEFLPLKGWRQIGKDETAILFEKGSQ